MKKWFIFLTVLVLAFSLAFALVSRILKGSNLLPAILSSSVSSAWILAREGVTASDNELTRIQTVDLTPHKEAQVFVMATGNPKTFSCSIFVEVFKNPTNSVTNLNLDPQSDPIDGISRAKWFIIKGGNHTRFRIGNLHITGGNKPAIQVFVKGD